MEAYLGFGFGHRECIKECIQATIESQWYHDSIRKYLRAHIKQLSRNLDDNNNNNNNSRKHDTEVDADTEAETETAVALVLDPVKKANRPDQSAADTVVGELGSNLGGDFNMKRFSSPPEYLSMKKTAINNNINNLQNSKTPQSNTIQSPHMDSNLGRMANPAPRERTEISDYARVLKKLAKTQINAYKNRSTIGNVRDIIGTTPRPVPIPGFKPLMTSIHATTTSGTSTDERYVPSDMNPNLYYYISNAYNELLATDPLLSIYYLIQDKLELSSASVSYQNQNQNQGINTSNYSSIWNASTNPIGSSRLNTSTIAHKSMVPSTNTSTPPTNTCFTGPSFQNSSSSRLNNRKSIPIKLNSAFTDHANSDALLMKNPIPKPPNQKNSIINDNSSQLPKTNTKTNTNTNTNTNFDVPKSTNEPQALDRSLTKRGSWFTSLFSNNKHNTLTDSQLKSKPQLKPESHSEKPKKIGKIKSLSRFLFSTSSNHGSSLQPDQKKSTRITSTLGATSPSSVDIRANTNDTKSSSLHLPINNDDNSNNDNNSNNSNNFNSTNTNYQRFDDFYKQIALKKLVSKSITSSLKKKAVIRDELIRGLDTLNISYTEGSGYFYCFLSEPRKESTTLPRLPSPSRHSASLSISFSSSDKVEVQAERRPEKKADLRAEQNLVLLPSSSTEAINFNVHTLAFYIYLVKFPSYVLPSAHGIEFMLHSGDFMRYKDVVSKLLDTIRI